MAEVLVAKVVDRGRARLGDFLEVVGEVEHEIVTLGNLENQCGARPKVAISTVRVGREPMRQRMKSVYLKQSGKHNQAIGHAAGDRIAAVLHVVEYHVHFQWEATRMQKKNIFFKMLMVRKCRKNRARKTGPEEPQLTLCH